MSLENQNCEPFEMFISSRLDDELTTDEQTLLDEHLQQCDSCQELVIRFQRVNASVESLSHPLSHPQPQTDASNQPDQATETFVVTRNKPVLKDWLSVWRLIPATTAAMVLVGLIVFATRTPEPIAAKQFSTDAFVEPVQQLQFISEQQQRDQDLMLRLLGMDLRSLRLELNQLDADSPERADFAKRIDAMIERVRNFESAQP